MVTPEGDYSFSGLRELCGQLEDYGNYLQELAENRNILNVSGLLEACLKIYKI